MATITKSCSLSATAGANTSKSDSATLDFSEMSSYSNACTVTQLKADFAIYQDQKTNIQYALYYETTIQQSLTYSETTYPGSTHNKTITKNISKTPYNFINDSIIQVAIGQNTPTFWGSQLTANVTVTATYTPGCYVNWYPKDPSGNTNNWQDTYPKNGSNNITFSSLTATGYKFDGWYTGTISGQGTKTTSATASVYDLNYHGEWTKWYKVIFYNQNGTAISTKTQQILGATGTSLTPDSSLNPSMTGCTFQGWTRTPDNGKNYKVIYTNTSYSVDNIVDNQINGVATVGGFEIKYYPVFKKEYQVIFNKVLNNASFSYVQSNYNNKIVGNVPTTPNAPTIATHQFLGWARDSSITASTAVLSGANQNCWTTIPAIANDQAGSTATSNGFPINYYAVWQERDSITFQENGSALTSTTGTYGDFTITGYVALENGIYYYDQGAYQNCTYLLNTTNTTGKSVYISSISTTSNLISGTKAADGRQWTATQRTATSGTAITINITLVKNALVTFFIYLKRRTDYSPSNFNSAFTITPTITVARNGWSLYTQNSSNTSADTAVPTWRSVSKKIYMNPTDSVSFISNCSDVNCYISRFLIPNGTNNMSTNWDPTQTVPSNLTEVQRITAKTNGTSNPIVYPALIDTNLNYTQSKGRYDFTATTLHMGTSISSNKNIKIYIEYEPFNCQFNITNINYTPTRAGNNTSNTNNCVSDNQTYLRIFNNASSPTTIALDGERRNNSTKYVISNTTINDVSLDFKKNDLFYGTNRINNFSVLTMTNDSNGNVGTVTQDNGQGYYLNRFIGYHVGPNDSSLINTYHEPYNINITWNNKDYKCFIILKLPVANDDINTTETDENSVTEKVLFTGTDWSSYSDTILNRGIYIKELTNTTTTSTINAIIQDIANSGYILKEIKKYSYNGNYNSTISETTITREQLDNESTSLPTGWTHNYSTTSNDVLTLSQNNLTNGAVDYYFITYEEGLPIFYPDNENNPKRAIQLYWEGNRAIGLYYENTRLL